MLSVIVYPTDIISISGSAIKFLFTGALFENTFESALVTGEHLTMLLTLETFSNISRRENTISAVSNLLACIPGASPTIWLLHLAPM